MTVYPGSCSAMALPQYRKRALFFSAVVYPYQCQWIAKIADSSRPTPQVVFSGCKTVRLLSALNLLLLIRAGDVELNPGPWTNPQLEAFHKLAENATRVMASLLDKYETGKWELASEPGPLGDNLSHSFQEMGKLYMDVSTEDKVRMADYYAVTPQTTETLYKFADILLRGSEFTILSRFNKALS